MRSDPRPYDVILRGGMIIDGSGGAPVRADVAVMGDRIAQIGDLSRSAALKSIDVEKSVVCPGFIDAHTHDDASLITRPQMLAKLTQGVTTVIAGNCGISGAPYSKAIDPNGLLRLVFRSDEAVAASFEQLVEKIEAAEPAINAALLTGHTTLRMQVMGGDLNRAASNSEISEMRDLLTESLEHGSIGLSSGLYYPAARAAPEREIVELATPLSAYRGVYATHMRDEADYVVDSIQETLRTARAIGAPVIISHHKCMGEKNFGRSVETLEIIRQARQQQPVALDVYPYVAGSTVLSAEMASFALKTLITWCDPYPEFCGRDLNEVARAMGRTLADTIPLLLPAGAIYFTMDEEDVTRIMCSSGAMIGSDGLPEDQHPHPRLWGTFPRVLGRYVRERHSLSLEDAVYRMTGLSADTFGLDNRGHVAEGRYADLCVLDAETIIDRATFEDPVVPAVGIQYVFVNGKLALEAGAPTGTRAGRLLRRSGVVRPA